MNENSKKAPNSSRSVSGWSWALAISAVGPLIFSSSRYLERQRSVSTLSAELQLLDAEWAATSNTLSEAREAQRKFEALAASLDRLRTESNSPSWTPALRAVKACEDSGIQLQEVRARRATESANTWTLVVGGISTGPVPTTVADRFRLALKRELEGKIHATVTADFQRLENLPEASSHQAGERQGVFTIHTTIRYTDNESSGMREGE